MGLSTALEFYSGIGGLHRAFEHCCPNGEITAAFDWDQNACKVYKANHPATKVQQIDICSLNPDHLADNFVVDLWLMSPSCQPYTVLNPNAKGEQDPRAKSFLHLILNVLPSLVARGSHPTHLLVENVAGFETSTTRETLTNTLRSLGYSFVEFLLTPLQFGIPNSRLRYYLLAKTAVFQLTPAPPRSMDSHSTYSLLRYIPGHKGGEAWSDPRLQQTPHHEAGAPQIRNYLDMDDHDTQSSALIPEKVLEKWGRLFDIVLPSSTRTCCFTRGYTQLVERSGSILQINEDLDTTTSFNQFLEAKSQEDPDALRFLRPLGLRYFSPTELLRLFCFLPLSPSSDSSEEFIWPDHISLKTKYRLIGNSVNVHVVSLLIKYLFNEINVDL